MLGTANIKLPLAVHTIITKENAVCNNIVESPTAKPAKGDRGFAQK